MKKVLTVISILFFFVSPCYATDNALFTHCISEWSALAVGETFCGWALQNGYPAYAPAGERSCAKAYELGINYFQWLPPSREHAVVLCALFSMQGPSLLNGW